jgi:hypothetical protein
MTLEEKIGQMSQIERANATAEVIEKYFVGESPSIVITGRPARGGPLFRRNSNSH